MNEAIMQTMIPFAITAVVLFIVAGLIWLFACHGIDKIRHPEEWTDEGKSGEQIIYRTLIDQIHVPENQVLRNVYVSTLTERLPRLTYSWFPRKDCCFLSARTMLGMSMAMRSGTNGYNISERRKAFSIIHSCRIDHTSNT